jgi:plastocyanin
VEDEMKALRVLALLILAGGTAAPNTAARPSVVEMTPYMTFMPRELSVVVGEVVVWKNAAEVPHTVNTDVANCKSDDAKQWIKIPAGATPVFSGKIKAGDEFRVRFEIPGTYQYLCVYHEDHLMRGTVVVQGAGVK